MIITLIITSGPGHFHNKLTSWIINHNVTCLEPSSYQYQIYSGRLGVFYRHCDQWNLHSHGKGLAKFYASYRAAKYPDYNYTKDKFQNFILGLNQLNVDTGTLSLYLNCLNPNDIFKWSKELNIKTATSNPSLEKMPYLNHYIEMEYAADAAQSINYNNVKYNLKEFSLFLKISNEKFKYYEKLSVKPDATFKIDTIARADSKSIAHIKENFQLLGLPKEFSVSDDEFLLRLKKYFKERIPTHPLMIELNELKWEEILYLSKDQ